MARQQLKIVSASEVQAILAKEKEDIDFTRKIGTSGDKKATIQQWIERTENKLAPVPVYAKGMLPQKTEQTLVVGCHRNETGAHKINAPFFVVNAPPKPLLYGCLYHPETEQTLSYFACKDKIYFAAGDESPREAQWDSENAPNLAWVSYATKLSESTQIIEDHAYQVSFALSWQPGNKRFIVHDIFVKIHGQDGFALPFWGQSKPHSNDASLQHGRLQQVPTNTRFERN